MFKSRPRRALLVGTDANSDNEEFVDNFGLEVTSRGTLQIDNHGPTVSARPDRSRPSASTCKNGDTPISC
jgi:hypothetical protein